MSCLLACSSGKAPPMGDIGDDSDGGGHHRKDAGAADSGEDHVSSDSGSSMIEDTGAATMRDSDVDAEVGPLIDASLMSHAYSFPKNCTAFDSKKVYVYGALLGIEGGSAIADALSPTHVCPGFKAATSLSIRPSDSTVVMISDEYTYETTKVPAQISVQRPDPFVFDFAKNYYVSPPDAWKNDDTLVTTCPDTTVIDFQRLLMKPAGGTAWVCNDKTYEFPGNELASGYDAVAFGEAGYLLVRTKSIPIKHGVLHNTTFTLLDAQWNYAEIHARSRTGGFWMAIANKVSGAAEQVAVDNDGSTQVMGEYADAPAPYSNGTSGVLDGTGRLWQLAGSDSIAYGVFYRPVKPGTSKVAYSMDDADPDMTIMPPRAYVDLNEAILFTGP